MRTPLDLRAHNNEKRAGQRMSLSINKEASMNKSLEGDRTHRPYTVSKVPHKVRIGLHLRGLISPEKIRRDLAVAVAFGLDPREVYEECVQDLLNGHTKLPFPPYCEVEPFLASALLTTNESVSDPHHT